MGDFSEADVTAVAKAYADWIGLVEPKEPEKILATRMLLAVAPAMRDRWLDELAADAQRTGLLRPRGHLVALWLELNRSGGERR